MGLSMSESNAIFLSTFDGFFEQKLKEPKPGSVQRVNKNNETINVFRFNTLVGKIAKIEYKVTEKFGDFWSVTIVDDRTYKLDLQVTSSSTFYFLNRLINAEINLKAPVELKVFAEVEDDKKKTVILLKQGGKMIQGVYSKDNPQDLPPMEKVMFKGKEQWDSTRRDVFLRGIIEKYVSPELDQSIIPTSTVQPGEEAHLDGPTDDKDLPDWAKAEATAPAPTPAPTPPQKQEAAPEPATSTPAPTVKEAPKRRG
jgi:hypothetical protein